MHHGLIRIGQDASRVDPATQCKVARRRSHGSPERCHTYEGIVGTNTQAVLHWQATTARAVAILSLKQWRSRNN